MRKVVLIALFLLGCGKEKVLDPYHFPSLIGTWMYDTLWVDWPKAPVIIDGKMHWVKKRRYNEYRYLIKIKEDGAYDARQDRIYDLRKEDGWPKDIKTSYYCIYRGDWFTEGRTLRLIVETVESRGDWGIYPGKEWSLVWFFHDNILHIVFRDRVGLFSEGSYVLKLKRIGKEDLAPLIF